MTGEMVAGYCRCYEARNGNKALEVVGAEIVVEIVVEIKMKVLY